MKPSHFTRSSALMLIVGLSCKFCAVMASEEAKDSHARGIVKSIDTQANHLVLVQEKPRSEYQYEWNDTAEFKAHGKVVSPAELRIGDRLSVTYAPAKDIRVLKSVRILSP